MILDECSTGVIGYRYSVGLSVYKATCFGTAGIVYVFIPFTALSCTLVLIMDGYC